MKISVFTQGVLSILPINHYGSSLQAFFQIEVQFYGVSSVLLFIFRLAHVLNSIGNPQSLIIVHVFMFTEYTDHIHWYVYWWRLYIQYYELHRFEY